MTSSSYRPAGVIIYWKATLEDDVQLLHVIMTSFWHHHVSLLYYGFSRRHRSPSDVLEDDVQLWAARHHDVIMTSLRVLTVCNLVSARSIVHYQAILEDDVQLWAACHHDSWICLCIGGHLWPLRRLWGIQTILSFIFLFPFRVCPSVLCLVLH